MNFRVEFRDVNKNYKNKHVSGGVYCIIYIIQMHTFTLLAAPWLDRHVNINNL